MNRKPMTRHRSLMFQLMTTMGCIWSLLFNQIAFADSPEIFRDTYPKIAGYQIAGQAWGDPAHRAAVAKRHLVIVGMWRNYSTTDTETGTRMEPADVIADIRAKAAARGNPGVLLLKYTNTMESSNKSTNKAKEDQFAKLSNEDGPGGDWWARNSAGENLSSWSGTWATNITRFVSPDSNGDTYAQWKIRRDYELFLADGSFDGLFIDNFFYRPRVTADWNGDGINDSKDDPEVRSWLRRGYLDSVERLRELDSNLFIMGNVDGNPVTDQGMLSEPEYKGLVGALYEFAMGRSFSRETWAGWNMMMKQYRTTLSNSRYGVTIFHVGGPATDYAFMRYALTSALMDDGYFDYSVEGDWKNVYWFDEFDANLGRATDTPPTSPWKHGVYMRRFEGGMALVNPKGNGTQTLTIPDGYRRILGTQDPNVNNGEVATIINLNPRDGIILLASGNSPDLKKPKAPTLLPN